MVAKSGSGLIAVTDCLEVVEKHAQSPHPSEGSLGDAYIVLVTEEAPIIVNVAEPILDQYPVFIEGVRLIFGDCIFVLFVLAHQVSSAGIGTVTDETRIEIKFRRQTFEQE